MVGRVLGWLLMQAPQPQSAENIAEGLQASRGAVSMATHSLASLISGAMVWA